MKYCLKDCTIRGAWAVVALAALASCDSDLRELCYDHRHQESQLNVRFDWTAVGDEAQPASMALGIFADGAQPVQTAFYGREGGVVSLLPYTYGFIGFNDDTEFLSHRGRTWEEFEIYAQPTELKHFTRMFSGTRSVPMARGTDDQQLVYEPDRLWTSAVSERRITAVGETLTMRMRDAITEYAFTVSNVENLSYAVEVVATLSGMSGSWLPASHRGTDTHCIIPFVLTGEDTTLSGTVRTFGHCPGKGSNHAEHMLTIYAEMKDGSKVYFVTDVTDAMHDTDHTNPDDGGTGHTEVPIVIDQLPLPKPIVNGSGLQPAVDEWTEVFISIPMG